MQKQMLQNFKTVRKSKQDGVNIFPENYTAISNYLCALSEEFKHKFQYFRNIGNMLLLVENPLAFGTGNNIKSEWCIGI